MERAEARDFRALSGPAPFSEAFFFPCDGMDKVKLFLDEPPWLAISADEQDQSFKSLKTKQNHSQTTKKNSKISTTAPVCFLQ